MVSKIYIRFLCLCFALPILAGFHSKDAPTSVTYDGYGTFTIEENADFCKYSLPQSPEQIEPSFLLYSRENPKEAEHLSWNNTQQIEDLKYFQVCFFLIF